MYPKPKQINTFSYLMDQKKDIAIIEFNYHSEVLLSSLLILKELPFKIYLFTTTLIWDRISISNKLDEITVYTANNHRDVKRLILENLAVIESCHAIIFNTLASHFKLFLSLELSKPVILRVHNANTYLNAVNSINPKFSLYYIWKDTSYLILHGLFKLEMINRARFVKKKVHYFLFPTQSIKDYVLKQGYLSPEKILPPIPYVFMKEEIKVKSDNKGVNIVIIGGIDKRRRNYEDVLNAFKLLVPELKTRVTLSLLGKPYGLYGRKVSNAFKGLDSEMFRVNTFKEFVSQSVFDKIMSQANFLIIPTVKETRFKLYKELYGFTKVSGSINDMVIYRKPALIPAFYPVDEALKPHVGTYKDEKDLTTILKNWIEKSAFENYAINSIIDEFNFESVVKKTFESLEGV